jgi:flagellar biogenesis protein FliO
VEFEGRQHRSSSASGLSATYVFALVLLIVVIVFASVASAGPATAPTTRPNAPAKPQATTNALSAIEHEPIRKNLSQEQRAAPATTQSSTSSIANRLPAAPSFDARRVGLSLGIVIGLILLARFAMKRLFPAASVGRSSQVIKVLSRSVIAPKQQFLLLQVGKRLIVVGDSGSSMNALAQIDDAQEVASIIGQLTSESSNSSATAFGALFRKQRSAFDERERERLPPPPPPPELADVPPPGDEEEKVASASNEITGLIERVKLVTQRLQRP